MVQTNSLQLLLQQFEVLLNSRSISWSHISAEHAQQTVQLLRQLQRQKTSKKNLDQSEEVISIFTGLPILDNSKTTLQVRVDFCCRARLIA